MRTVIVLLTLLAVAAPAWAQKKKKNGKSAVAEYFEMDLLTTPEIEDLAKRAVCVKLDREDEAAKSFQFTRPTPAILNSEGKILKKFEESVAPAAFLAPVKKLK